MKFFLSATGLAILLAVSGCSNAATDTADIEGDRAPLTGPGDHTMNSPTTGPTSEGLSGGTDTSAPPDLVAPDRGTIVR